MGRFLPVRPVSEVLGLWVGPHHPGQVAAQLTGVGWRLPVHKVRNPQWAFATLSLRNACFPSCMQET